MNSNEWLSIANVVHCQRRSLESNSMADRVLYGYETKRTNSSPKTGVPGTELNRMPENPCIISSQPYGIPSKKEQIDSNR